MMKSYKLLAATIAMGSLLTSPALARQDASPAPFIGQIKYFAGNFCPVGSLPADGSILNISDYTAAYSLLGTNFGGDGRRTFGLPDLGGRFAVGAAFSTPILVGHTLGSAEVVLTPDQIPAHSHEFYGTSAAPTTGEAEGNALASFATVQGYALPNNPQVTMHPDSITEGGGGQPLEVQDPYLTVTACMYVTGAFPSRS